MAWSPKKEGFLLSGSDDNKIRLWDTPNCTSSECDAMTQFNAHSSVVEDVQFHCHDANIFGSCGDDKMLMLWDLRGFHKAHQCNPGARCICELSVVQLKLGVSPLHRF